MSSAPFPHRPSGPSQPRASQQTDAVSPHPGWPARSLIWLAIVLYTVPPLLAEPLREISPVLGNLYAVAVNVARGLVMLVGTSALLFAKQTTWTRRVVATVLFFFTWFIVLIVMPLLPLFMAPPADGLSDAVRVPLGLTVLFGATYVAWNCVRNRRWWILVLSVVYAGVFAVVESLVLVALRSVGTVSSLSTAIVVGVSLLLLLGGLGIFHLLGKIRGAAVPSPASPTQSSHAQRFEHISPYDLDPAAFPGYPGAVDPGAVDPRAVDPRRSQGGPQEQFAEVRADNSRFSGQSDAPGSRNRP